MFLVAWSRKLLVVIHNFTVDLILDMIFTYTSIIDFSAGKFYVAETNLPCLLV
jgi:hypothetical protein